MTDGSPVPSPQPGSIAWTDLTVADAAGIRDFYAAVVGWKVQGIDMGGYEDFCMIPAAGQTPAAGICHARGTNADLPPVWLIYILVESVDDAVRRCADNGGSVLVQPRSMGHGRFCVIKDPAGAICGLYQQQV